MVHCHSPTYVESWPLKIQPFIVYKSDYPNYISTWQPKHVTIKLFEIIDITRYVLAHNLIDLLEKYGLKEKKHCLHVKNEKYNLNVMTNTLKFIMSFEVFGLEESFQEKRFNHVFSN